MKLTKQSCRPMKKFGFISFVFMLLLVLSCQEKTHFTFYVDAISGDDDNSGLSPSEAWKSVNNVNRDLIRPGDMILLKGNQTFAGNIVLESIYGNADYPVVFSSYGGGKAFIKADDSSGLIFKNCEYVLVKNLQITGSGRLKGNNGSGLELQSCNKCMVDSITVSGFMWSGIHVVGGKNIRITNVHASDNGFCGILAESGAREYGEDGSLFKTLKNLYIGYSKVENNPGCPLIADNHSGNGILVAGVVNGIVEHCEAFNNGWDMPREGNGPVGIWAYMSDSITIQYCYSHHNKTSAKGKDGGGFDFDGGIRNSIMQYNLSAFNEGAGYGIFQYAGAKEWSNNVIRYNISYNDGSKNGKSGIFMWYDPEALPMKDFKAHNNLIVTNQPYAVNFDPGVYTNFLFENNDFYFTETTDGGIGGNFSEAQFVNNNYWSYYCERNRLPQPGINHDHTAKYVKPEWEYSELQPDDFSLLDIKNQLQRFLKVKEIAN